MNMPPIKFEIKPGLWVGVGDRVWALYGDPMVGVITGFSGDEDEWLVAEIVHTDKPIDGYSRQTRMNHDLKRLFATEEDAWKYRIQGMVEELNELHRRAGILNKAIMDLKSKWGI